MNRLTHDERARLGAIADVLIPRAFGMPSGTDADIQGEYIDHVFEVRPDLLETVRAGLAGLPDELPETFESLEALGLASLRSLADAITAAYFINPDVARLVGYRKRSVIPIRFDEDLDDLVTQVVERGPIYRPTPPLAATEQ